MSTIKLSYLNPATPYTEALAIQEQAVTDIINGDAREQLLFCEHSAIYTCGTSAHIATEILHPSDIPLIKTGRGGKVTYHGLGQRVIYPILNLGDNKREKDLRKYIQDLQKWLILTLKEFGIDAHSDDDVGVWVTIPQINSPHKGAAPKEAKIAAIGIRVRKWVTFHGIALNIAPDLTAYQNIIPCGITDKSVTSMAELGCDASMEEVDKVLLAKFEEVFTVKIF